MEENKNNVSKTRSTTTGAKKTATKKKSRKDSPTRGRTSLILLCLLIILIIAFCISTFRKFNIMKDLNNKFYEYAAISNYYEKATPTTDDSPIVSMEVYKTENTVKNISEFTTGSMIQIISKTAGTKEFYNSSNGKIMRYSDNKDLEPIIQVVNYTEDQTLLSSMFLTISSKTIDGVDCYCISNLFKSKSSNGDNPGKVYIEKETGLVKQTDGMKYEYSFGTVTEEDLKAPDDIGEYLVKNN